MSLSRIRDAILLSYAWDILDIEEIILLYDINKGKIQNFRTGNLTISMSEEESKTEFRFTKDGVNRLILVLDIPMEIYASNRLITSRNKSSSMFAFHNLFCCLD